MASKKTLKDYEMVTDKCNPRGTSGINSFKVMNIKVFDKSIGSKLRRMYHSQKIWVHLDVRQKLSAIKDRFYLFY